MNKERLLKLADLLKADAANPKGSKFDLSTWAGYGEEDTFPSPRKFKKLDCNTSACAVGLACLSGIFKKDGLRWKSMDDENSINPLYKGDDGFYAVSKFFDISENEALHLFTDVAYAGCDLPTAGAAGERAVAKRIRDFVAAA